MAESSPVSLDQLMKAADVVTGLANNAAQLLIGGAKRASEIQEGRETAAQESINDAALVNAQKGAADLNAQQNARKAASAFAINMDEANQMVVSMGQKFVTNATRAAELSDDIRKRSAVKPWEDPITWIGNQIVIPFQQEELQAATAAADIAQKSIVAANNAVQEQAVTENAIKESITTETQAAQQRLFIKEAQEKLAQLQLQGIALNSGNLKAVYEMTSAQMDTYLKINNAFSSQQYLEMARQTHALNSARWSQELQDKKDVAAEEQNIADTVNAGRAALNLPPLPAKHIKQQLKMGGEVSKILQDNYITGAANRNSGTPIVGETPAKAAEIIVKSSAPLTTEQQGVKKFLIDATSTAATTIPPTIDVKGNPKAATDYVNKTIIDSANRQQKNIKTGDATNIYAATSLKAITGANDFKGTVYYDKVIAPLVSSGYDKVDPEDLVSKLSAAVQQGQIPFDQAVLGLAATFRGAVAVNNETRRYGMFGLPRQAGYSVTINTSFRSPAGTFGGGVVATQTYNLTEPAQVSVLLSRHLAAQRSGDIASVFNRPVIGK